MIRLPTVEQCLKCNFKKDKKMSYSYELSEKKCVLFNVLGATETDFGVKASIFKNVANAIPLPYIKHAHVIEKLFTDRADYPSDVVFIQVSSPGHAFQAYDSEPCTITITLNAYFRLLEFVRNDLKKVVGKLESDCNLLTQKKDCIYITPTICSDSIEHVVYDHPLDVFGENKLHFLVKRSVATKETLFLLKYSEDSLGQLALPIKPIYSLSDDRVTLMKLLNYKDYKDKTAKKRSR